FAGLLLEFGQTYIQPDKFFDDWRLICRGGTGWINDLSHSIFKRPAKYVSCYWQGLTNSGDALFDLCRESLPGGLALLLIYEFANVADNTWNRAACECAEAFSDRAALILSKVFSRLK